MVVHFTVGLNPFHEELRNIREREGSVPSPRLWVLSSKLCVGEATNGGILTEVCRLLVAHNKGGRLQLEGAACWQFEGVGPGRPSNGAEAEALDNVRARRG